MTSLSITMKNLSIKSFLLAFFLHLIIFSSIIFVFSIKFSQQKPQLYFLGPILKSQDFVETILKGIPSNQSQEDAISIPSFKKPFILFPPQKPFAAYPLKTNDKMNPKSTFLNSSKEINRLKQQNLDLGIDLDLAPYRTLRINPL